MTGSCRINMFFPSTKSLWVYTYTSTASLPTFSSMSDQDCQRLNRLLQKEEETNGVYVPYRKYSSVLQMKCRARQRRPRKDPAPNPHHWKVGLAKNLGSTTRLCILPKFSPCSIHDKLKESHHYWCNWDPSKAINRNSEAPII